MDTQQPYLVAYNSPKTGSGEELYSKSYIQALIVKESQLVGIDPEIMLAISKCESHYQMIWNWLHDTDPDYYTAYGPFMIVAGHEKTFGFDRMTLNGNIQIAIRLYLKNGLKDWSQSLNCIQGVLK